MKLAKRHFDCERHRIIIQIVSCLTSLFSKTDGLHPNHANIWEHFKTIFASLYIYVCFKLESKSVKRLQVKQYFYETRVTLANALSWPDLIYQNKKNIYSSKLTKHNDKAPFCIINSESSSSMFMSVFPWAFSINFLQLTFAR